MSTDILNTIVLAVVLSLVIGGGVFVTKKKQPERMERLEQEEKALQLRQAEISELLVLEAESAERAADALRRWNSRYKVLPEQLTSPAVVQYINALSSVGFKTMDVSLGGITRKPEFSTLSYRISGRGYFESLYRFIWNVENGRGMYRVRGLDMKAAIQMDKGEEGELPRRRDLVDFSMTLDAYYGGADGMSAPDSFVTVPDHVLPARTPASNAFFPLVMAELPPNTDNLVDVEADDLVSVLGEVAVFRDELGARPVREGDNVYLGTITRVDPNEARVVASLNKGGIRERIEISLATGERFRQAIGTPRLAPMSDNGLLPAPPAPGTPEARRSSATQISPETPTSPRFDDADSSPTPR